MSSLRGVSSEAACPSFKKKGRSKAALMVRKERTNHLDGGNRMALGALNFNAGDHRFLLPTRPRRGFGVTSHILCKPKPLAIDDFGLLTNYLNFFHPHAERAYDVAIHWRQHAFSPWFRCLLCKQSCKENLEVDRGLPLAMAFLVPSRQHLSSIFPLA